MNIIHTCTLIEKSEPTGPYEPYTPMVDGRVAGPRGHVHIIFGDVNMDETPGILDILKEKENTKVTFFTHTDKMDKEGVPELMKRIIEEVRYVVMSLEVSTLQQYLKKYISCVLFFQSKTSIHIAGPYHWKYGSFQ